MTVQHPPRLRIGIDRIRIEGAPASLRDSGAFSRVLDQALSRALGSLGRDEVTGREVSSLGIQIPPDSGADQIAEALANAIVRAVRGGRSS